MASSLILGSLAVTGMLLGARTDQESSRTEAAHKVPLARILLAVLQEKKVARGSFHLPLV